MTISKQSTWVMGGVASLALALGGMACGDKGAAGGGGGDDDFSAATLAPVDVDVEGQKISVSVPTGFTLDTSGFIRFQSPLKDNFSLPSFTFNLESIPPKTLDKVKLTSGTKDKPMVETKRVEVAGGFLVAGHNSTKGTAELTFIKPLPGGKAVSCRGVQARSKGVPNLEATLAMFEKACTSMQLK